MDTAISTCVYSVYGILVFPTKRLKSNSTV